MCTGGFSGLYPSGFRENYGGPMEREFRDELAESGSGWAMAMLWIRLLSDLAILHCGADVKREMSQDGRHYALRLWARRPWLMGFAILALAIGIGANTGRLQYRQLTAVAVAALS